MSVTWYNSGGNEVSSFSAAKSVIVAITFDKRRSNSCPLNPILLSGCDGDTIVGSTIQNEVIVEGTFQLKDCPTKFNYNEESMEHKLEGCGFKNPTCV